MSLIMNESSQIFYPHNNTKIRLISTLNSRMPSKVQKQKRASKKHEVLMERRIFSVSRPKVDDDRFFRASSVSECALTPNKLHWFIWEEHRIFIKEVSIL